MSNKLDLDYLYNDRVLNIFSDASIDKSGVYGAYCSMSICKNTFLEQAVFTTENLTNNYLELCGIRLSLWFAYKYQYSGFTTINIFSDSKISVDNIRNFRKHKCKPIKDENNNIIDYRLFSKSTGNEFSNQDVLNDCIYLYNELCNNPNIVVNLLWQPSHIINTNDFKSYIHSFQMHNSTTYIPTINFLGYICKYNELCDTLANMARIEMEKRSNMYKQYYTCPVHFKPLNIPKEYFERR